MKSPSIRIVGGNLKGQTIRVPAGHGVRPTAQKAREAVFDILRERIQRATVADLFAGTGAMGLEALSRGAARVAFVDHQRALMTALEQSIARLKPEGHTLTITADIHLAIQNTDLLGWVPFDVLMLDPPYHVPMNRILLSVATAQLLQPNGLAVYEHFHKTAAAPSIGPWTLVRTARYGDTAFSFYESRVA